MRRGFPIFVIMVLIAQGCTDMSEPGVESLVDPSVKPKVIYTYPPINSEGPYEEKDYYYLAYNRPIIIRFNKIMDENSVFRSFSIKTQGATYIITDPYPVVSVIGGDQFAIMPFDTQDGIKAFDYEDCMVNQSYILNISSDAEDINKNKLTPPFSMTFVPEPYFRVKEVHPPDGTSNFTFGYIISLELNSPVDQSFFSFISINPPLEGTWNFYADASKSVYFKNTNLLPNKTYTITINEGARDQYNNPLNSRFSSTFSTPGLYVTSKYPYGYQEVNLSDSIIIDFSFPIDTSIMRNAFMITPNTQGRLYTKLNASEMVFRPQPELLPYTYYSVKIDTTLTTKNGFKLVAPYTFSFSTSEFKVLYRHPTAWQSEVSLSTSIGASFSAKLDSSTIRSSLSIDPPVAGWFIFLHQGEYFDFIPQNLLNENTTYSVTIDTTLRSIGGLRLSKNFKFSFTTGYESSIANHPEL